MSYSTPAKFCSYWGLPETALADQTGFDPAVLQSASAARIDTALRTAGNDVPLPAASVTDEIRRWEDILTAWDALNFYGFDALARNSESVKERYDEVVKDLEKVAEGKLKPIPISPVTGETQDATPTESALSFAVAAEPRRGW